MNNRKDWIQPSTPMPTKLTRLLHPMKVISFSRAWEEPMRYMVVVQILIREVICISVLKKKENGQWHNILAAVSTRGPKNPIPVFRPMVNHCFLRVKEILSAIP